MLTTPLLRAIKRAKPRAEITFVTKAAYAPLLAGNPNVERVVTLAPNEPLRHLASRLRAPRPDYRIDLHGSLRSFGLRMLLGGRWHSYRKRRMVRRMRLLRGNGGGSRGLPVAQRYFGAARALEVTVDNGPPELFPSSEDEARAAELVPEGCVVLAPGAGHATKRWPPEHWRRLADGLLSKRVPVVALGGAAERCLLTGGSLIEVYEEPLGVAAAVLRRARVAVCNDSGLMHMATATGTRVVALFGPTAEAFGFFPHSRSSTVLQRAMSCRPCSLHGSSRCPLGHHQCMTEIRPEEVAAAVGDVA